MGPIEHNNTYPLSSEPAEGYGTDPAERSGKVILINAKNLKFIKIEGDNVEQVTDRAEATRFDSHAEAALKAAEVLSQAKQKASQPEKLAA